MVNGNRAVVTLSRQELFKRLVQFAVWRDMLAAELRKECYKVGVSPIGDPQEVLARLVAAQWPANPTAANATKGERPAPPSFAGGKGYSAGRGAGPGGAQRRRPAPPPHRPSPGSSSQKLVKYFEVLQLPPTAGTGEVRRAYRKLALLHHPDKNPDGPRRPTRSSGNSSRPTRPY